MVNKRFHMSDFKENKLCNCAASSKYEIGNLKFEIFQRNLTHFKSEVVKINYCSCRETPSVF